MSQPEDRKIDEKCARSAVLAGVALALALIAATASAQTIIWNQPVNYSTFADWGPSQIGQQPGWSVNAELADDFDLTGTITRVDVMGYNPAMVPLPAGTFRGVYVRFYSGADAGGAPADLQSEEFVAAGSPNLWIDNAGIPSDFRITLAQPFHASGRHFVSVQAAMDSAYWYWRSSADGQPRGTALWYRDNETAPAAWTHTFSYGTANADQAFSLWGESVPAQPVLTSLSTAAAPRSDRFRVRGSGFGVSQGTSRVLVGGLPAPVTRWSETEITAYVPEAAVLGTDPVQVATGGGSSNTIALGVTPRVAGGDIRWRFRADGFYIMGRPAVASDGTIYAGDVDGHLYALDPSGGLKWIFALGNGYVVSSIDVGRDGTIYFASGPVVYAINPDGTRKWSVTNPSFGTIFFGPNVGPDGKIYAVGDEGGSNSLGAFAVSPEGAIAWSVPGFLRFGSTGLNREIAFDGIQMYFSANKLDATSGLRGLDLADGAQRFVMPGSNNPAASPKYGLIWTQTFNMSGFSGGLAAYHDDGSLFIRMDDAGLSTRPQTGPDGSVYFGNGIGAWKALNPDGTPRWRVTTGAARIVQVPNVSPDNQVVVAGEYEVSGFSNFRGMSASNGALLWTIQLPAENGGWVRPMSPARFSADGGTFYVGMDVNDGAPDPYTYLYAFPTHGADRVDTVPVAAQSPRPPTAGVRER